MTTIETSTGAYRLTSITYTAESASIPGRTYRVTVTDDGWECSCKAREFTTTRGRCWHLKAAQAGSLGKPRVRIMPLPAAAVDPRIAARAGQSGAD